MPPNPTVRASNIVLTTLLLPLDPRKRLVSPLTKGRLTALMRFRLDAMPPKGNYVLTFKLHAI